MTYTKGPWIVGSNKVDVLCREEPHPYALIANTNTGYKEDGTGVYGIGEDEAKANARLISAAPELYEAAKMLQELMTAHSDNFRMEAKEIATDLMASTMIEKFRKAIA